MQEEARWQRDFLENMLQRDMKPVSAGTKPTPEINPIAVEAMKEIGIDLSKQKPKVLTNEMINRFNSER